MRIGVLGGPGPCAGAPLEEALRRLAKEIDRRCWGMVLRIPGVVAFDTIGPEAEIVEVVPRDAEPATGVLDRRAVDGHLGRRDTVRLLWMPSCPTHSVRHRAATPSLPQSKIYFVAGVSAEIVRRTRTGLLSLYRASAHVLGESAARRRTGNGRGIPARQCARRGSLSSPRATYGSSTYPTCN
jgi:hypothetical protein